MPSSRPLAASAAALGLALLAAGCANTELEQRRARIDALDPVVVQIDEVTCSLFSSEGCRWAALVGPDGTEYAAVSFDPDTGEEDFATQRFLGLDEDELLALEGRGDAGALYKPAAVRAACLWVPNCQWYVGSSAIPGHAEASDATPREVDVLNRQSQLLAFLLARLRVPDRLSHPTVATVWTADNCSLAPDFSFTTACCARHDACYAAGGSLGDRDDCDEELCECIADNGFPVLGRIYYAAVRAFGWPFFGR